MSWKKLLLLVILVAVGFYGFYSMYYKPDDYAWMKFKGQYFTDTSNNFQEIGRRTIGTKTYIEEILEFSVPAFLKFTLSNISPSDGLLNLVLGLEIYRNVDQDSIFFQVPIYFGAPKQSFGLGNPSGLSGKMTVSHYKEKPSVFIVYVSSVNAFFLNEVKDKPERSNMTLEDTKSDMAQAEMSFKEVKRSLDEMFDYPELYYKDGVDLLFVNTNEPAKLRFSSVPSDFTNAPEVLIPHNKIASGIFTFENGAYVKYAHTIQQKRQMEHLTMLSLSPGIFIRFEPIDERARILVQEPTRHGIMWGILLRNMYYVMQFGKQLDLVDKYLLEKKENLTKEEERTLTGAKRKLAYLGVE